MQIKKKQSGSLGEDITGQPMTGVSGLGRAVQVKIRRTGALRELHSPWRRPEIRVDTVGDFTNITNLHQNFPLYKMNDPRKLF